MILGNGLGLRTGQARDLGDVCLRRGQLGVKLEACTSLVEEIFVKALRIQEQRPAQWMHPWLIEVAGPC